MNGVIDVTTTTKLYRQEALVPPRGAAIARVIFSLLTIVGLGLVRYAVPADPSLPGIWLTEPTHRNAVRLALDLFRLPVSRFCGSSACFVAVLGEREDQFFATVFI